MNPPLRAAADREALIEGICDGTIDMIATDHAPHSAEEKAKGLSGSAFGIVGIESAFALLYTGLVKKGIITLDKLISIMATKPRERFGIPMANDFTIWDLSQAEIIDPDSFISLGRATPFAGCEVSGKCCLTVCGGRTAYKCV